VYVENLVHACVLAGDAIMENERIGGEAYFINDDMPVNNFDFIGKIVYGLGYKYVFLFYVPMKMMYYLAYGIEGLHHVVKKTFNVKISPFLTRAEVLKVGVTHYFSVDKARRDLGYEVIVKPNEALSRTIEWYRNNGLGPRKGETWLVFLRLIAILIIIYILVLFFKK